MSLINCASNHLISVRDTLFSLEKPVSRLRRVKGRGIKNRCTINQLKLGTSVLFYALSARFPGVMYHESVFSWYIGSVGGCAGGSGIRGRLFCLRKRWSRLSETDLSAGGSGIFCRRVADLSG